MVFDWLDAPFDLHSISPREIEESFEDPFSLRMMPEDSPGPEARYYNLGQTIDGRPVFSVFWTDGKKHRVVASRDMTPEESGFYDRINAEAGM